MKLPADLTRRILSGRPIFGQTFGPSMVYSYSEVEDQVANALYTRKWLVELKYAQHRFVVAISNVEAKTPEQALHLAHSRATRASYDSKRQSTLSVGNLMEYRVLPDCEEARETLGVAGPKSHVEHTSMRPA